MNRERAQAFVAALNALCEEHRINILISEWLTGAFFDARESDQAALQELEASFFVHDEGKLVIDSFVIDVKKTEAAAPPEPTLEKWAETTAAQLLSIEPDRREWLYLLTQDKIDEAHKTGIVCRLLARLGCFKRVGSTRDYKRIPEPAQAVAELMKSRSESLADAMARKGAG